MGRKHAALLSAIVNLLFALAPSLCNGLLCPMVQVRLPPRRHPNVMRAEVLQQQITSSSRNSIGARLARSMQSQLSAAPRQLWIGFRQVLFSNETRAVLFLLFLCARTIRAPSTPSESRTIAKIMLKLAEWQPIMRHYVTIVACCGWSIKLHKVLPQVVTPRRLVLASTIPTVGVLYLLEAAIPVPAKMLQRGIWEIATPIAITPFYEEFVYRQFTSTLRPSEKPTKADKGKWKVFSLWNLSSSILFALVHLHNHKVTLMTLLEPRARSLDWRRLLLGFRPRSDAALEQLWVVKGITYYVCGTFLYSFLFFGPLFEKYGYFAAAGAHSACNLIELLVRRFGLWGVLSSFALIFCLPVTRTNDAGEWIPIPQPSHKKKPTEAVNDTRPVQRRRKKVTDEGFVDQPFIVSKTEDFDFDGTYDLASLETMQSKTWPELMDKLSDALWPLHQKAIEWILTSQPSHKKKPREAANDTRQVQRRRKRATHQKLIPD